MGRSVRFCTEFRQPERHAAVDLVQDQDDHQVDDDRRRRHRHPDVGFDLRVGAHGHQGRHGDAVDDDAEDGGEGQAKLEAEQRRKKGKNSLKGVQDNRNAGVRPGYWLPTMKRMEETLIQYPASRSFQVSFSTAA